jgi:hypothetical protein
VGRPEKSSGRSRATPAGTQMRVTWRPYASNNAFLRRIHCSLTAVKTCWWKVKPGRKPRAEVRPTLSSRAASPSDRRD